MSNDINTEGLEGAQEPMSANEIEALQAEVADLRAQVAEEQSSHTGRKVAVALLILLGCILAAGTNVGVWVRSTLVDSDSWVAAVGPLTNDEVVVNALSVYVVDQVFEQIDAEQLAQEALPEQYSFLIDPLVSAIEDLVTDLVAGVIRSDQFRAVWEAFNRTLHEALVDILLGESVLGGDRELLYLQEGQLILDLSDLVGFVQNTLRLGDLVPVGDEVTGTFVLLESEQLAGMQRVVTLVNRLGIWLPLLTLLAFFIAWLISLWRRETLMWIGIGLAITMAISLLVMLIGDPFVTTSVADPVMRSLVTSAWETLLRGLYIQTLLLLIFGLVLAAGAALAGPDSWAEEAREAVSGWFD